MRKFIKIVESNQKNLFHATYLPYLDSIFKYGIDPNRGIANWEDSEKVVYLANDVYVAESYAEESEELEEDYPIVVLEVSREALDDNLLVADSNVIDGTDTFEYHNIINPSAVVRIHTNSDTGDEIARKYNIPTLSL